MMEWMTRRMDGWKASFRPRRPLIYKMYTCINTVTNTCHKYLCGGHATTILSDSGLPSAN
jgi:hypothetical protein